MVIIAPHASYNLSGVGYSFIISNTNPDKNMILDIAEKRIGFNIRVRYQKVKQV